MLSFITIVVGFDYLVDLVGVGQKTRVSNLNPNLIYNVTYVSLAIYLM